MELKMTDLYSNPSLIPEVLYYKDGNLYWKKKMSTRLLAGTKVGCQDTNGRLRFNHKKKNYSVHRVIYLMHHNTLPAVLDHIDGNCLNNRIENLREASQMQNMWNQKISKNNKSGVKGVCWNAHIKKWQAQCMVNGKRHNIGFFNDLNDAKSRLEQFRLTNHGKFARNS